MVQIHAPWHALQFQAHNGQYCKEKIQQVYTAECHLIFELPQRGLSHVCLIGRAQVGWEGGVPQGTELILSLADTQESILFWDNGNIDNRVSMSYSL